MSTVARCENCQTKAANYGNPSKKGRVDPEAEKLVTSPDGCDASVEFKGMGVRGVGEAFEPVSYHPRPLGDHDVEIKISHCGICASDIHTIDAGWSDYVNFPVIPGHEIVGVVTAAGAKARHAVGDRVGVGAQVCSCFQCEECKAGIENHCLKSTYTYNSQYPDGQFAFGGYANAVRVDSRFAFKVPSAFKSEEAAPLFCAGATVYSPLARYIKRPGMNVGVIGIGGLGHLAVQFAAKMGAKVTAISSSAKKKDDAFKLGATDYLDMSNAKDRERGRRKFDLIINSVTTTSTDVAKDYENWLRLCAIDGILCMVGLPDDHVKFNVFAVVGNRAHFTGSSIGSPQEIEDMLKFAAEHNVKPWIDVRPLSSATQAVQEVREGKPRFRYVLDTSK